MSVSELRTSRPDGAIELTRRNGQLRIAGGTAQAPAAEGHAEPPAVDRVHAAPLAHPGPNLIPPGRVAFNIAPGAGDGAAAPPPTGWNRIAMGLPRPDAPGPQAARMNVRRSLALAFVAGTGAGGLSVGLFSHLTRPAPRVVEVPRASDPLTRPAPIVIYVPRGLRPTNNVSGPLNSAESPLAAAQESPLAAEPENAPLTPFEPEWNSGVAVASAPQPQPEPKSAKQIDESTASVPETLVKNGTFTIAAPLLKDYGVAREYLSQSPTFADFLNELSSKHAITIVPPRDLTVVNPEAELAGSGDEVRWEPYFGRRAQQLLVDNVPLECKTQSPAVELIRSLYTTFGAQQYPTYAKMLQCIGDLFHGNQDNFRVNKKVNEGLRVLGELGAEFRSPLVFARNVTASVRCNPVPEPLTVDVSHRNPVLADRGQPACTALSTSYNAPFGREYVDDSEDGVVKLTDKELKSITSLKQRSQDLELRAADAARTNGTSPFEFAEENQAIRKETAAVLRAVRDRVGSGPDPFFDPGVHTESTRKAKSWAQDTDDNASGDLPTRRNFTMTEPAPPPSTRHNISTPLLRNEGPSRKSITGVTYVSPSLDRAKAYPESAPPAAEITAAPAPAPSAPALRRILHPMPR